MPKISFSHKNILAFRNFLHNCFSDCATGTDPNFACAHSTKFARFLFLLRWVTPNKDNGMDIETKKMTKLRREAALFSNSLCL